MSKSIVIEREDREAIADPVTDLLRAGAQELIQRAVEAKLSELLSQHNDRRTEKGNAWVVRNGYLPERELQTGLGPVTVQIPKVRAKTGEAVTFRSALVPPYIRKTKSLEAAVPWLYLKGVSSGEMGEALKVLVGPQAQGLSASTVSRLKQVWGEEYRQSCEERLDANRSVVAWIGVAMEFALSQAVASGDTFEHRPSECGHCVQDFLADLDLRDLPGEAAGSESGADDALPPADLRFYPAALVVPCGHLPGHAAVAADLGNMAIPNGWIPR